MSVEILYKNRHPVFIGIYKITSPTGKVYIGQSWDIIERWRAYKSAYPLRGQPKLANSLRKYGAAAHQFQIVDWFSAGCSQKDLDNSEVSNMGVQRDAGIELLNIREGGRGGKPHPDTNRKMVETRRKNGSYAHTDEMRKRASERLKGHPGCKHTDETKRHLSELAKGRSQSTAAREKNRQSQLGRKHSAETKAKIGAGNRGNKRPDLAARNRRGPTAGQRQKTSTTLRRRNALKRTGGRQGRLFS